MKIVLYSINYFPELTGIGKYVGEMAEWLVMRGHQVRVVTASPYYPGWVISEGYSGCKYSRRKINGVDVFRCPLWVPRKPSGIKRLIHLASFALTSAPAMFLQIFWKPDLVFVVEPPLFCAPFALLTSRLSHAKAWLHVQDFEVDAAFDLGIMNSNIMKNVVHNFEKFLMKRFDKVSTISSKMLEKLGNKGVEKSKTTFFPNWVDTRMIYPISQSSMRANLGILENDIVCLYSGSMGEKQGLEILVDVARLLRNESNVHFVICGNGPARDRLIVLGSDLCNIIWLPLQPIDKLNDLLGIADIHLLAQRADVADLVLPSKLAGMLASGKPVIATANPGTEIALTLSQCGKVVEPGNALTLANAILDLVRDGLGREALGIKGRMYALEYLNMNLVLSRFEKMAKEF